MKHLDEMSGFFILADNCAFTKLKPVSRIAEKVLISLGTNKSVCSRKINTRKTAHRSFFFCDIMCLYLKTLFMLILPIHGVLNCIFTFAPFSPNFAMPATSLSLFRYF